MPSDGYVEGHRNAVVTADNHGPVLEIIVWFLMVVMICAALLKLAVRSIARGLGLDDLLVSVGLVGFTPVRYSRIRADMCAL